MSHRVVVVFAILAVASPASAEGIMRKKLGEGYELVVLARAGGVEIRKGKQRARIAPAIYLTKVTVDAKARKVDVDIEDGSCTSPTHHTWEFAQLDARMENTTAFTLHQKKDYKASALGFARAVAADPKWNIPAYNLASAHTLLGDQDAAIAALAPWLAADPLATYVQISADPELAPLRDRAEIRALRSKTAGAVKLGEAGVEGGGVAYAPDRKLIAVVRLEGSWGGPGHQIDLEIYDLSGKRMASTPLVLWSESPVCYEPSCAIGPRAKAAIARRIAAAQAMLGELGFMTPALELNTPIVLVEEAKSYFPKQKATFVKAKLGIVVLDGTARILANNTLLASATIMDLLEKAAYIDELRAVVVWSHRPGREGCDSTDPTQISVITLPAKKP